MNSIVSINKEEDISKITKETKYINIPIDIVDNNINNYFLINGVDYSYSESINSKQGFIYTDYNMFKQGELLIDSIIKDIPQNLSDIEKVRYIYITLGKELNIDINTLSSKNEILSLHNITNLNNIWGALSKKSITRSSILTWFLLGIQLLTMLSRIIGRTVFLLLQLLVCLLLKKASMHLIQERWQLSLMSIGMILAIMRSWILWLAIQTLALSILSILISSLDTPRLGLKICVSTWKRTGLISDARFCLSGLLLQRTLPSIKKILILSEVC